MTVISTRTNYKDFHSCCVICTCVVHGPWVFLHLHTMPIMLHSVRVTIWSERSMMTGKRLIKTFCYDVTLNYINARFYWHVNKIDILILILHCLFFKQWWKTIKTIYIVRWKGSMAVMKSVVLYICFIYLSCVIVYKMLYTLKLYNWSILQGSHSL